MTPVTLLDNINAALADGKTVRIATTYKCTDVTAKTVDRFRSRGYELFCADEKCLYIRRGKHWDAIYMTSGGNSVQITAYT